MTIFPGAHTRDVYNIHKLATLHNIERKTSALIKLETFLPYIFSTINNRIEGNYVIHSTSSPAYFERRIASNAGVKLPSSRKKVCGVFTVR